MYICTLTQTAATIKCAFLRDKKRVSLLLLVMLLGNTNLFLDLKEYPSLEHDTKNTFFY